MVGDLIRLRWTIQRHTPRGKRLLGMALGVAAAVLTWAGVLVAAPPARADVFTLILAVWFAGWIVGPILSSGASVLRPEYFTLLPLAHRKLGFGLLASVFVGVGAGVTALGFLALVAYALLVGPLWTVLVALLGAGLFLVFVVAASRAVYAVLGAAMRTNVGVELASVQYGLLLSSMFAGWLVINPMVSAVPVFLERGFGGDVAGVVLGWSPAGWPVRAVDAFAVGDFAAGLGWLAMLGAAAALAVAASVRLLTPYVGNRTARRRRVPLGSRVLDRPRRLPASPFGAVLGKEIRTWLRDPWRSLEIRSSIWTGVFLAVYVMIAGIPEWAGLGALGVAFLVGLGAANLYGQDGTALWQLVVAQDAHVVRADVRGRQCALLLVFGSVAFGLLAVLSVIGGVFTAVVPLTAVILALLGVGSGVAVLTSVLGVTPGVDPHRRVNPTDAGENNVALQIALWSTIVLVSPTVGMAIPLAFAPVPDWFPVATLVVALLNGGLVGWVLGRLAVHRLTHHLPETFARLRYPGAHAGVGTRRGVLDHVAAMAEDETAKTRAAAR